MQNWQDTSKNTKTSRVPEGQRQRYRRIKSSILQNMARQLRRWQRFAKLPGMAGERSDALLSVHDAPRLLRSQEADCPEKGSGFLHVHDQKVGTIQRFRLEGICTVTQWQAFFGREIPRKCTSKTNGRTYQHGNVCTCIESSGCSCRSPWTTSKWLGRADPRTHVENSAKEIDVEEPTPLIDPVCLGCTQRERNKDGLSSSSTQN